MLRPLLGHSLSQINKKKGRAIRDEAVKICTICLRDETSDIRDLVSLVHLETQTFDCRNFLMRPPQWSSGQSSWLQNGDVLCFL
jgi:hypothetical protein